MKKFIITTTLILSINTWTMDHQNNNNSLAIKNSPLFIDQTDLLTIIISRSGYRSSTNYLQNHRPSKPQQKLDVVGETIINTHASTHMHNKKFSLCRHLKHCIQCNTGWTKSSNKNPLIFVVNDTHTAPHTMQKNQPSKLQPTLNSITKTNNTAQLLIPSSESLHEVLTNYGYALMAARTKLLDNIGGQQLSQEVITHYIRTALHEHNNLYSPEELDKHTNNIIRIITRISTPCQQQAKL